MPPSYHHAMKRTMTLVALVLGLSFAGAGCKSKKQSREDMCKDGQKAFEKGMAGALQSRLAGMPPEARTMVEGKIETAKRNFMKFCTELTDQEIKCITKQDVSSPTCQNVMTLVKTKLLEM